MLGGRWFATSQSIWASRRWRLPLLVIFLAALCGCVKVERETEKGRERTEEAPAPAAAVAKAEAQVRQEAPPQTSAVDLSTAIIQVAKQTIPAVVHIEVTERQEVVSPFSFFQGDPFLRRFFGTPDVPKKFRREQKGLGTGMIMDPEGHILTNNHVVGGATKIQVLLANGEEYPGKLIGTDPKTDLAVVQISAKGSLPTVPFGDSDKVEVGEWVVAIGHPRGLDQTVTQGIISAKHRRGITDPSSYEDFLQTDAAINPGNSGGPLLNLHGQVIGVNAAIASQSGGSEGIGFAIPSNMALHVARQLIQSGKVERGWLGVSVQDLTPDIARSMGLSITQGALVADVVSGSPAEKAGVRRGDVIVAFGEEKITDSGGLRNLAASTTAGKEVKVAVVRKGGKEILTVRVGDFQDATRLLASAVKDRLGVTVQPVGAKEAERYGLEPRQGVEIASVDASGPLGSAGLEVKDLVLEINGQSVEGVEGFVGIVNGLTPRQRVAILALDHRTGNTGYVQVTVK